MNPKILFRRVAIAEAITWALLLAGMFLKYVTETTVPPASRVLALQCLLTEQDIYHGKLNGKWNKATANAIQAWQTKVGMPVGDVWWRKNWMSLLSWGEQPVLKYGSTGAEVRRLQRTLNASGVGDPVPVTGRFKSDTGLTLRAWQAEAGVEVSGVASRESWKALSAGVS